MTIRKVTPGISVILIIFIFGYFYVVYDQPYESFSTKGLRQTSSQDIIEGKSIDTRDTLGGWNIRSSGTWFKDNTGRKMLLRGLNLGGNTKLPYDPKIPSHESDDFFEGSEISFVGRPFPLKEADEHFKRIQQWGFHFLRFLVTWEAIEHEGPGIYDSAYLDYVHSIIEKANEYNINVFIDPHQDVWSRYSGGSGAPKWTFDSVGLDVTKFKGSGAAVVHNTYRDPFPRMIWPTNYGKLATATMFTLFFGVNDFAHKTLIDSIPAQEFLQGHFIDAMKQVAKKVKGLPNVVGFETMNEPTLGYIGKSLEDYSFLKNGVTPNFYQGMVAGAGTPIEVETWTTTSTQLVQEEDQILNPEGISAWSNGYEPVWKEHGIWDYDQSGTPKLLQPDYFQVENPNKQYFKPYADRYSKAIREIDDRFLIFMEPPLQTEMPSWKGEPTEHFVNATHWYDGVTLFLKEYIPYFTIDNKTLDLIIGKRQVRNHFDEVVADLKNGTIHTMGDRPTLIGEFGVPMDLNEAKAFQSGDFSEQEKALDRVFQAIDKNMLHYALWTYVEDNTNKRGDQWNGEDLSIFSEDQRTNSDDVYSGDRALNAVIRPYPYKTSGTPLFQQFNMTKKEYVFKYEAETSDVPTEIFIPEWHFGEGFELYYSSGRVAFDKEAQMLLHYPENNGESILIIRKRL
ncbi:MAG: cellulase family glycosylhydrolase [Bacteroidota bacterium]